jgi:hypothetical protein
LTDTNFEARLAAFIPALDAYVAAYYDKHFPTNRKPTHRVDRGPKWTRVVQVQYDDGGGSAYCFIGPDGKIYKPNGWSGPHRKNPRGSIFDDNFSLGKGLTPYGAAYLR